MGALRMTAAVPNRKSYAGRMRSPWSAMSVHLGLICVCVGYLLPFAWMVSTSLKTLEHTSDVPPTFIPHPWQPQNYVKVFTHPTFHAVLFTRNTLIIAILTVFGTTLSSAIVAYGFARIPFRGRGILFAIMLATIMIPFPVVMVSTFRIFRWMDIHTTAWLGPGNPLQMLGTFKPLWLPAWFGSAFNIFLLRQFFMTLPKELSEAAKIDGCSEWAIFWRVILPLAKPALAVVALFSFMYVWNDYLAPLVYIQRPDQYTLALGLEAFQNKQGGTDWTLLMAASILVCLPTLILFFLAQRTFIEGIATTGGK
ncbi:MAG TPA: carbohydrate ABC transporter permease [Tepidisphaeraceae bacterium]|nr:carbohydrate ABC transporter permease [Tepidisphaeraceae bacterium]